MEKFATSEEMNQNNRHSQNREKIIAAEKIFSYENLLKQYYQCRKRKRNTINAIKFEMNLENELLKLQKELETQIYNPGRSIYFVVTKPKPREIFAAGFRDRVVHHVLVDYLEPIWEPKFIDQSYSCRKKRGAHKAIEDLKKYLRIITNNHRRPAYYLQLDIRSFFMSLDKDILFALINKRVKNSKVLWLAKKIIFHDPTTNYYCKSKMSLLKLIPSHKSLFGVAKSQGLPIGNLTSQFFANVYLNEMDQFVKHQLKIKYYLRYVDDLVILSENKEELKIWRDRIDKFLQEKLKLKLHPQKQILQEVNKGINFVGGIIRMDYVLMRKRVINNLRQRLLNFNQCPITTREMLSTINSYYGQFKNCNTFHLRKKLWHKNFNELNNIFIPVDSNFSYFKIKQ
ncbi:MAG TPA: reverse transcriptase/maturase family protein [Candidatus Portnoybacteria bacterium]|nr:reverse transcriptase/maturase family protein [Candidatus Portnoybacteria bacterium]MDD5752089.1 reverse transcriptase/maturase family protein [Candidatus Portnoybacteria bacterium]HNU96979.1 reverse transcriptase/maturase family protein [Candidatus Portnoybacteria bacterium]HOZ16315.1 reverse transcriptase/maturase family protein [Candidatus Portnoybacteria bacterium]HPH51889.1 reverse transcriptase/maturase family protein [Candidatus Portnoybacteria bacterium]